MALVADYSSCSESESDDEEEIQSLKGEKQKPTEAKNGDDEDDIVDEDEAHRTALPSDNIEDSGPGILDETTEDIPGKPLILL